MTEETKQDRRHDARRSGYEMRTGDRREDDSEWPYLEKRGSDERRAPEDRRHAQRRHDLGRKQD